MLVNQMQLIEDLGPLARNPCLDNNQGHTFLPIQYSFSYLVENPGVCFMIGISGNRKIHNKILGASNLLIFFFNFRLWVKSVLKKKLFPENQQPWFWTSWSYTSRFSGGMRDLHWRSSWVCLLLWYAEVWNIASFGTSQPLCDSSKARILHCQSSGHR